MCKMVVNRKRGQERMKKKADGKEVQEETKPTPLISQAKAPKKKGGKDEKMQVFLEPMKNINVTFLLLLLLNIIISTSE